MLSRKLLMSGQAKRSAKADDGVLLSQIEAVDVEAGKQFLEYIVLHKQSNVCNQYTPRSSLTLILFQDPSLHTRLAQRYLDQLILALQIGEVHEFFKTSGIPSACLGKYYIHEKSSSFGVLYTKQLHSFSYSSRHHRRGIVALVRTCPNPLSRHPFLARL